MSNKKLIAIVLNTSWNIYNFRMNIVKSLVLQGYKVLCIAPEDNYSKYLVFEGVDFVPIKMESRGVNPFKDLLLIFNLWRIFRAYKPAVVLQYTIKPNLYGTLASKLCGIPVVNNVSGLGTVFLNNNFSSKIARAMYRFAFRFPYRVFFQNPDDNKLFVDSGLVKASICNIIPGSGVDLKKFKVSEFKRNTPFLFLMASRLIYDKGLMEYLEACVIVKSQYGNKVEFALQGAPSDNNVVGITAYDIDRITSHYPIKYYPFTDRIEDFINEADVIVLPSYREGLSRLLLESAAMGKPLIASNVPGCRDVVRNGINGLLCDVKSSKDLSAVMIAMLEKTDEELFQFSINSRTIVEKEFSEEIVIEAYLEAVKSAIKKDEK